MAESSRLRAALVAVVICVACGGPPPAEVCGDGEDNDGDQLVDCDDDECGEDPACDVLGMILEANDSQDLPEPDGDPSLDIESVTFTLDLGALTADFNMFGPWRPSQAFYSYYVGCYLYAAGAAMPTVSVITQRHDGVDDVLVTGVPATDVTVTDAADGPTITIANAPAFDRVHAESGLQKTNPGNFTGDQVRTPAGDPIPFP